MVLEKTLESSLDSKEIKPVHPKGNQFWIFTGRTDAEAEAPILWPLDEKSWLIRKDPDAGKDRRQKKKEMTEDEIVGWHHQLDRHEFEQAPGLSNGQESLACCSPRGWEESAITEWLNSQLNGKESSCNIGFASWDWKICWRRDRLPTPVLFLGEFHGLFSPWSHKELDTTEQLSLSHCLLCSLCLCVISAERDSHNYWKMALVIRNLPTNKQMQETQAPSLGQEVALEEGMATCSSILAWKILWTEEPNGL